MLDQSSYRSEIVRMLAAKPQVIFTEVDPQTAATFLSELQQLNGSLLPIIGTETTLEAPWLRAVTQAVGSNTLSQSFAAVEPYAPTSGPAYETFNSSLRLVKGVDATDLALYSTDPYAMGYYDSITIMALAMIAAKSTDPTKFNGAIVSVTAPGSGKVVVSSFAEGEKALSAGKQIQYVGAAGPVVFNTWHSSTGAFEIAGYVSAGKVRNLGSVSAAQIAALSG
jgi:Receptor family ligand binding region.